MVSIIGKQTGWTFTTWPPNPLPQEISNRKIITWLWHNVHACILPLFFYIFLYYKVSVYLLKLMIAYTRVPHLKAVSVRLEAKTHVTFVALEHCAFPQFFWKVCTGHNIHALPVWYVATGAVLFLFPSELVRRDGSPVPPLLHTIEWPISLEILWV